MFVFIFSLLLFAAVVGYMLWVDYVYHPEWDDQRRWKHYFKLFIMCAALIFLGVLIGNIGIGFMGLVFIIIIFGVMKCFLYNYFWSILRKEYTIRNIDAVKNTLIGAHLAVSSSCIFLGYSM